MRKNEVAENLDVSGSATIGGTLTVAGNIAVSGTSDLDVADAFTAGTIASDAQVSATTYVSAGTYCQSPVFQSTAVKTLTAANATTFVNIAVPTTAALRWAAGQIHYTLLAYDATDTQVATGILMFTATNKASTITCDIKDNLLYSYSTTEAASTGMTAVFTIVDGTGETVDIKCNATSGLTETAIKLYYTVFMQNNNTVTAG